ncbi:transposase [Desulfitobacterium sp. AusDCA]|uniref:transposase n=1 Tax=Desulfitobacterium sp. AusDCA TaxID=3240383 RepID=UPI003DA6FF08
MEIHCQSKGAESSGILSGLKPPDTGEYDLQVHKLLTRKQTNEVKIHPDIYRFLPKNTAFDYLDTREQLYYPMSSRVVYVKINVDTYQCIITNLSAEEFSSEKIKTLYHMRWEIETSFRELKYTIGLNFQQIDHLLISHA